jgi:small subunit ribosomal protein S20
MPHSVSAAKRVRQNFKRRLKNREVKAELKDLTKKLLASIKAKKKDESVQAYRNLASHYDRAAKKGVIHRRNASRHKSRLAQRLAESVA